MQTLSPELNKAKKRFYDIGRAKLFHEIPILLIDDDPEFADLLYSQLRRIPGARVTVARDACEAVSMLADHRFVLVVSDWSLDSKTALDVLNAADPIVHRYAPEYSVKTPVLFISGSEKVNAAQNFRALSHFEPVSFILKRFGPPLISLLAENIVERFYAAEGRSAGTYLS
jgi:CheY-like chemotaxis protein